MTRRQTLAGFAATVATASFGAVAAVRHAAADVPGAVFGLT